MIKLTLQSLKKNEPFIIAEIGNNHQGSLKKAIKLVEAAYESGSSAVKFQTRNIKSLYTESMYKMHYQNDNSFGDTYGEHRDFLELKKNDYFKLKKLTHKLGMFFISTPFDNESVELLNLINIDAFKIASADITNLELQQRIAKKNKIIFLSTGGCNFIDIKRAVKNIQKFHNKLVILHCTASYPSEIDDLNLLFIKKLVSYFPENIIGLSDHENGIDAAPIAYMLGARVFEKHFTLNRAWKGTDHAFSLEPTGLKKFSRNLNRIKLMLGDGKKKIFKSEIKPIEKMSKSIVAKIGIEKGKIISKNDLCLKSPGGHMKPYEIEKIIGSIASRNIKKHEFIKRNFYKKK